MLTGNKDVDRKILNELKDVDLVKACQVNKQADNICNDQVFWMNRVFDRFPYVGGDILRANKGTERSWSDYYIHDLRKIQFDPDKYLEDGSTNGRLDQVIISLKKGADMYSVDEYGDDDGALRSATKYGHLEVVKYLIENGTGAHTDDKEYAIGLASKYGHLEIVKNLVENGGDIHAYHNWSLRLASKYGHLEVVKYLVENGADIHDLNDEALRDAIRNGHTKVVEYMESL